MVGSIMFYKIQFLVFFSFFFHKKNSCGYSSSKYTQCMFYGEIEKMIPKLLSNTPSYQVLRCNHSEREIGGNDGIGS